MWARRDFMVAGLSAAAGLFFMNRSLIFAGRGAFSGDPVSNLLATGMQGVRADAAVEGLEITNPLARARLETTARTRRRNVVLIHLESTRERSVTSYNQDLQTMPFLDELAGRSLLVERAYTTTPHTSKALTAINSGLYSHPGTGIIEAQPGTIEARCLPELLGDHGYRTAWFQSATEEFENRHQQVKNFGYEHFEAMEQMEKSGFEKANYLGYEDDIMLEPSRRWLEEDLESPSFTMYLGVTPHHQYLAPAGRYGREHFSDDDVLDRYLNSIRYDDFFTENVINLYKELGLYEDTIFVIYGDHGEAFGEHGVTGHDGVVYEEGLRVPLVIHDPQRFTSGERIEGPANLLDFAPTLVDLLGYEVVDGEYPGSSLARPLPEDRTLMFSCRPDLLHLASIKDHEKYVHNYDKKPDELYDLATDPLETRNLMHEMSLTEHEARRTELLDWRARTIAMYGERK
jgi:arylsulfatase A-like enzyme